MPTAGECLMRILLALCLISIFGAAGAQSPKVNELPEVVYLPAAPQKYVWERVVQVKKRILFYNTVACTDSAVYSFGGFDTLHVQREMNRLEHGKLVKDAISYPGKGFISNIFFIRDSLMYIGGGHDSGRSRYAWNDFWEYNRHSRKWKRLRDLPFYYRTPPYSFEENDHQVVLIASLYGDDFRHAKPVFYRYDPAADSWSVFSPELAGAPGRDERTASTASLQPIAFRIDRRIFVLFQWLCNGQDRCETKFYEFDLSTATWRSPAPFPGQLRNWGFAVSDDIYGYIGGGNSGRSMVNRKEVYRYDPERDKWEQIASLPRGVRYAKGWRFNGEIYAGFGINDKLGTVTVWRLKRK